MKISKRLGFVAHRRASVSRCPPKRRPLKSRQNRIEDADDGKFESRRFFVEAEAIGASLPATGGIRPML
jgi:hypothetical protein